jgi:dipeptidyl aminopeptidase/acylaminoacyl peptidase
MSAQPTSPYKGLNAFDDSDLDALLFFGREREREIVVANLIASRLTVLYGPSGVGKSSLLRAAVARKLRELPEAPLVIVFSRWSDDPAAGLAEAVDEALGGASPSASPLEALERAQSERDVYLVLDQVEEYFLYHAEDRGHGSFAEALPAALAATKRVNVLISLREDALAKLDRFTGRIPGLFGNTLRLDRLDRQAARAAILGPVERFAELTGRAVAVEDELVERVLDEVGTGRIEPALGGLGTVESARDGARVEAPYLQLVMQRLWEEEQASDSSTLRVATLERLGGAQHVVEEHLEGALDELTSEQKDIAARLFNHLVTPSGTKIAHEVGDLADFGQVTPERLRPVLTTLADRRILRSLEEGPDVRYEIFHDVLAQPVLAWRAHHRTERAVENQLAEAHRRRSRLQRLLALGFVLGGVLVAATAFALVQRSNASDKERDALARQLDASAISLLATDPELGLLLAVESARRSPGSTTEDALRQSLLSSHVRALMRASGPVGEVEFSPDGTLVAFADSEGWASVRLVSSGKELFRRRVGERGGVSFSPDGASLVLHGGAVPPLQVSATNGAVECVLDREKRAVADATVVGDYAVMVRNARGSVWRRSTCRRVREIPDVGSTAVSLVASPEGSRVAFVSGPKALIVGVPSGEIQLELEHPAPIASLAFDADAETIITGGGRTNRRIWSGVTGRVRRELRGDQGHVLEVTLDREGLAAATAGTDGTGRVWDALGGTVRAILFGHTNWVDGVDFSPDAQSVVTASLDGSARTWAVNGRPLAVLTGHTGAVLDAHFSPDGTLVATAGEDGTVRIWDAETRGDLVRGDLEPPEPAAQEATSPAGDASARIDGRVVLVERADGTTSELTGHKRLVTSVAFSPDGRRLVTASRDRDVILWDVASGKPLKVLRGHFNAVSDARFSPDGRWIVTAGPRSVGLWKASTGELVRLLRGPAGPFRAVAFSPDSRTIVAATGRGVVSSYDCRVCGEIPELLELAEKRLAATGRELTPEERELYLG